MGCGGEEVVPRNRIICMRLFAECSNFTHDMWLYL